MTVEELIERLRQFPGKMEVEIEVLEPVKGIRLWGEIETVDQEADVVNVFAKHVAV